jgi:uncharacterized integral membrane protein
VSDSEDPESNDDTQRTPSAQSSRQRGEHFRHTRISAAWVSVVVAIVFGVALIDFIAQNTTYVRIDFFTESGRMPLSVALLVAALLGAIVVVGVGIGRVAQLRLTMRRLRRQHEAERDEKR